MSAVVSEGAVPHSGRRSVAAACGAAALGPLLFLPALWSGRIADDYVLEQTLQKASGLGWVFTHNDLGQASGAGHFYRPLWVLWNLVLFDVSHSALLAHVGNLVLFGLLCVEVVVLVWRLTRDVGAAAVTGGLFAVFPSHGESVAWISGNTDLLAGVLAMGCVLVAVGVAPGWRADLAVLVTAALAMLAKEIAFVLPLLLALVVWARPDEPGADASRYGLRSGRWRPVWSALVAAVAVFVVRVIVIGGAGGYGPAFTLKRLVGSAATFLLATFSAPQTALIRHPVLLAIPVILIAAGVWLAARVLRSGDRARGRLVLLGVGWFVIGLLPVLNQPLDLNTRNGDRLLLLSSVGIVIAVAAVLDLQRLWGRLVVGVLVLVCGVACLQNAFAWHSAGVESDRLIAEMNHLATAPGAIVALSFPTDLGEAHLFPDALETAIQEHGRPGADVITCAPMHPSTPQAGQTTFTQLKGGVWLGRTSAANPFTVGVLSASSVSADVGCSAVKVPAGGSAGLGTALEMTAQPAVTASPRNILYFNGRDFVRALH